MAARLVRLQKKGAANQQAKRMKEQEQRAASEAAKLRKQNEKRSAAAERARRGRAQLISTSELGVTEGLG